MSNHYCDFNQMLELKIDSERNHIDDFKLDELNKRNIFIGQYCFGCTAGAGSSCSGAFIKQFIKEMKYLPVN